MFSISLCEIRYNRIVPVINSAIFSPIYSSRSISTPSIYRTTLGQKFTNCNISKNIYTYSRTMSTSTTTTIPTLPGTGVIALNNYAGFTNITAGELIKLCPRGKYNFNITTDVRNEI